MTRRPLSLQAMTLSTKVILLAMVVVTLTAGAIWITVSRQTWSQMEAEQRSNGERNLRTLALVLAARLPGTTADVTEARIAKVVAPSLAGFADASVVDDAVAYSGGVATVFSYEPATGTFLRRQTTVRGQDGARAVGTLLAADSPAQAAVRAGRTYEGPAVLFGRRYYTVYQPTLDAAGTVNGILFIGLPIEMYFDAYAQTMTSLSVAALVIAVLACALVGLVAARLFRPFAAISSRIEALAADDLETPIPHTGRGDEIGAVARSLEVLRSAGLRTRELEGLQSAGAADEARRRANLDRVIEAFRRQVVVLKGSLTASTGEMRARADEMVATSAEAEVAVAETERGSHETSASAFTSDATTAKPLPAAPARAASMVALSASRLVCPAMFEISPTTSPIRETTVLSSSTSAPVWSVSDTASRASCAEPSTCRPISWTEEPSSSAAAATVLTLTAAASAATATVVDRLAVRVAVTVIVCAVAWSSEAEAETWPMMPPIAASKLSAISRMPSLRCSSAANRACAVSCSRLRARIMLSLKIWTAPAIAPTSSRRPKAGMAVSVSPDAS